jgi:SM-20-related protein
MNLNVNSDIANLARKLKDQTRVSIKGILDEPSCKVISKALLDQSIWKLVFNQGHRVFDLDQTQTRAMKAHVQQELGQKISHYDQSGFQYIYDSHRISDLTESGQPCTKPFYDLHKFLNSPTFLAFCRDLTDDQDINYLDLQATRYRRGHFLTEHTDAATGLFRKYAFVLNMTPVWRPDWGGILMFLNDDGHIAQGFTPAFNTLNILKVPQRHSVSI